MMTFKQKLKPFVPQPLWHLARDSWLGLKHATQWPLATFHPWRRASMALERTAHAIGSSFAICSCIFRRFRRYSALSIVNLAVCVRRMQR